VSKSAESRKNVL